METARFATPERLVKMAFLDIHHVGPINHDLVRVTEHSVFPKTEEEAFIIEYNLTPHVSKGDDKQETLQSQAMFCPGPDKVELITEILNIA